MRHHRIRLPRARFLRATVFVTSAVMVLVCGVAARDEMRFCDGADRRRRG